MQMRDRNTFYTFDARGYTDYPFYREQAGVIPAQQLNRN
jgi:hypothetical protein